MRPHRVRLFEGVRAHPGRGDAARQRAWRGPRLPCLTGVVVGRPTAEDSIVLTPVGVPSISFAIKICERPDAGVAEDEPGFSAALSPSAPQRSSSYVGGAKNRQAEAKKIVIAAITPSAKKRWSLFPGAGTRDDSDDISASKFLIFEVLHSVALSCGCCRSEKNLCPSGPECALLEQPFGRWWTRTKPLSAACAVANPRRTPTQR